MLFTEESVAEVTRLHNLVAHHLHQLGEAGVLDEATERQGAELRGHLAGPRPWDGITSFEGTGEAIIAAYRQARAAIIEVGRVSMCWVSSASGPPTVRPAMRSVARL